MSVAVTPLRAVLPPNYRRQIALAFPIDWNARREFRVPCEADGLGPYYIEWNAGTGTYGEDWDVSPRDPSGVLLTAGPTPAYHPIRIAQYALHAHDRLLLERRADAGRVFLTQAKWLRDNQVERAGVGGCYPFSFAWEKYGAKPGWISAMGQGEAISVLTRAEALHPGQGFGEAAVRAFEPFTRTIDRGGVVSRSKAGDTFFEEAAVEPSAHILNGSLYAMFGLYDLARACNVAAASVLFEDGVATLLRRLELFDSGYWSYYSLLAGRNGSRHVATLKYHAFHIAQLHVLSAMAGDLFFTRIARRWSYYRSQLPSRIQVVGNELAGLTARFVTKADTVPGGARGIL